MTPDEIKAILVKMNDDAWHKRDLEAAYQVYSDDVVFQRVPFPPLSGKEANRQGDQATLAAFSNVQSTIREIVVEGDTSVIHWTWEGDHTGTTLSLGIDPTGKRVSFSGCSIYHFREGKIAEQWEYGDMLSMLQQLGVIPPLG
jgi:steroid delta-isomerase-like uncharacterized protein